MDIILCLIGGLMIYFFIRAFYPSKPMPKGNLWEGRYYYIDEKGCRKKK